MTEGQKQLRFGVFLPSYVIAGEPPPSAALLQSFARQVEDLGFDSLWVFDHLFEAPPSYRVVFLEPLTSLALVAGATNRVTLGTGILILPLRNPVITAKELATIDAASEGRLILGIGVGWPELEFRACQVPKRTRGRRMDEMVEIIKGLWTNDTFAYQGEIFDIPEVRLVPRPAQRPHPPIWFAGGTVPKGTSQHITTSKGYTPERSLQRVAQMGDGLMTAYRSARGTDGSQLKASWERVLSEAEAIGRDPSELCFAHQDHVYIDLDPKPERMRQVLERFSFNAYEETASIYLMGHPEELIPRFQARIDAGVDELTFNLMEADPHQLELFNEKIRPYLRARSDSD